MDLAASRDSKDPSRESLGFGPEHVAGSPRPLPLLAIGFRMAERYGHIGSQALRDAANVLGRGKIAPDPLKSSQSRSKWRMLQWQ